MKQKLLFPLRSTNLLRSLACAMLPFLTTCLTTYAGTIDTGNSPLIQKLNASLWDQQYMLGDWGGARTELAKRGITFQLKISAT